MIHSMHVRSHRLTTALKDAGLLVAVTGTLPEFIDAITDDSRAVKPGGLFVAVRGVDQDGHEFLAAAERGGVTAAIVEDAEATALPSWVVSDARRAAAIAAATFYGEPSHALTFVGVTGTNGKTTTVGMLRHLLDDSCVRAASIGTLGVLVGSEGVSLEGGAGLTTPGPIELQRILRELVKAGVGTVAMEVSSHSLHQRRVEGIQFAAAVFTNLTRDHLDYHGTMEAYFAAKASLLQWLTPNGAAIVNSDDPSWRALPVAPRLVTFGTFDAAAVSTDVSAELARYTPRGSSWLLATPAGNAPVELPLIGEFNVSNALGAAAAAFALGRAPEEIASRLSTMPQVAGRLEIIGEGPTILRDYAHTPDALERALLAMRPFTLGKLIVVFGAGGDRDKGKRPLMAQIADRLADTVVVTSDNPRTEDPERILDDIVAPLPPGRYERIEDRRAAIARAIAVADPARDVVLLAGKGHETYQIRGTVKHHFDEREIVQNILAGRNTEVGRA
jgi:UDP-N-acetylmuramoyl-L-alanyl-D-glutamate--2,6-diaminopimelate ligase